MNQITLLCTRSCYFFRTVSKAAGESLATEFDSNFAETSAADDLASVERVFHDLLREISRVNDGPLALQPLFITEDQGSSRTAMRRTKSPRNPDLKDSKDRKEDKDLRNIPRRTVSTFKIFNKGFKIFNWYWCLSNVCNICRDLHMCDWYNSIYHAPYYFMDCLYHNLCIIYTLSCFVVAWHQFIPDISFECIH